MKVISISLWGTDPMYTQGAIENAKLAGIMYPGWEFWVYHDNTVPTGCLTALSRLGAILKPQREGKGYIRLFWRFLPAALKWVDRFVSRDADSRLSFREAQAVKEWEATGDKFHVMRDHPNHNHPMLGGMWGCVSGAIPHALETITTGAHNAAMSKIVTFQGDGFNEDQLWLRSVVWPIARKSCTQHDECEDRLKYGEQHPFPAHRKDKFSFIGNKYTASGEPVYSIESR